MRFSSAVGLTLAAVSQGFLLPPEVSESDVNIVNALGVTSVDSYPVELPCPGCPVQVKNRHGKIRVKTNKPNHVSLLFKIDHQDDGDRLLLNGYQLYPTPDVAQPLTAPQTIDRHHNRKHKQHSPEEKKKWEEKHKGKWGEKHKGPFHHEVVPTVMGFSLATFVQPADPSTGSELSTVSLEFQIIEVGKQFVDNIPKVIAKLAKDAENRLTIQDISVDSSIPIPWTSTSATPSTPGETCQTPLCQWLAFIKGKLGRPTGNCGDKNKQGQALQSHHKFRPQHFQRPQRTWGRLLRNIVTHIILPVVIGIVAGVGASLLGMMVGTGIVMVWRLLFRRDALRCPRASRHKAAKKEAVAIEEKAGLLEEENSPPAYEEHETAVNAPEEIPEETLEEATEEAPKA